MNRIDARLLADLDAMSAITAIEVEPPAPYPTLRVQGPLDAAASLAIIARCQAHGVLVIGFDPPMEKPTFFKVPSLEPMAISTGMVELMRGLHAGYSTQLLREQGPTALFTDLAAAVAQAQFHRLLLGPHQANADLICRLIEGA